MISRVAQVLYGWMDMYNTFFLFFFCQSYRTLCIQRHSFNMRLLYASLSLFVSYWILVSSFMFLCVLHSSSPIFPVSYPLFPLFFSLSFGVIFLSVYVYMSSFGIKSDEKCMGRNWWWFLGADSSSRLHEPKFWWYCSYLWPSKIAHRISFPFVSSF